MTYKGLIVIEPPGTITFVSQLDPGSISDKEFVAKSGKVKESQTIASVRIHVERAIQRIKEFRLIRNKIPLNLHGSINQIWTVCVFLCNFMPPLIVKTAEYVDSAK